MYKIRYIVCAETILTDAQTNLVSVINILEDLTPESLPAFFPEFWIIGCFGKDENDPSAFNLQLKISLNEDVLVNSELNSNFLDQSTCRQMVNISNLPVIKSGQLLIEFLGPDGLEGSYFITVNEPRTKPVLKPKNPSRAGKKKAAIT